MPARQRPPTPGMIRTLALIELSGVHAYSPDGYFADDLPLVAILADPWRTPLPVRAVRGLLARELVAEVWDATGEFPELEISEAGRAFLFDLNVGGRVVK